MTLSEVAVRINANGLLHIPNLAHPLVKGVRIQAVEALKKTSSKMLMPAFAMRQRGQDLPLGGRKKSPVTMGPRFTATLGTLYRDNRDCRPSRETHVCAMHTLWHGCGPKEWQFRTRGALCAQTSRSPPCLRRREQPQSGHMAKEQVCSAHAL